jgi:hypothetical protein
LTCRLALTALGACALTLAATIATILAVSSSAAWATPTQVNVRIEGKTETLFEGPIWTEGHDVQASSDTKERSCDGINPNDPQNVTPGPTPTAASVDAMSLIGETFDAQWYGGGLDDYFVTRWGPDEQSATEGAYWGILVNNVYTDVGGCQYELSRSDEVLWAYNAFASKPILALFATNEHYTSGTRPLTATAQLEEPFEVEVVSYDDHGEGQPPATPERTPGNTKPYEGADVSPAQTSTKGFEKVQTESTETVHTDAEGKANITFTAPGWHRIKATAVNAEGEETAIRSNRLDVCVPAAGATGCGEPPAEDQVRTPQYIEEARKREAESGSLPVTPVKATPGPPTDTAPSGAGQPADSGSSTTTPVRVQIPTHKMTLTRAQRLAMALKQCKREQPRKKRVSCEKQARKRYAPKAKNKKHA